MECQRPAGNDTSSPPRTTRRGQQLVKAGARAQARGGAGSAGELGVLPRSWASAHAPRYAPHVDDTHPEIERQMLEGYRRMTGAQKLARVGALTRASRQLALARVREEHPLANLRELQLRVAALRFDRTTMVRAFGWDPDEHGA